MKAMKTVSFDDDAYRILKGLKTNPGESFSDVVKRHLGRAVDLDDSAGGWADVPESRVRRLRRETIESFGSTLR